MPWFGGVWPVSSKQAHPVLGWLYTIHTRNEVNGLIIHYNVSQEDIVREIDLHCTFKVGQTVELGPFARRRIMRRKWDFQRGEMVYFIEGPREGREWGVHQTELVRRIAGQEKAL